MDEQLLRIIRRQIRAEREAGFEPSEILLTRETFLKLIPLFFHSPEGIPMIEGLKVYACTVQEQGVVLKTEAEDYHLEDDEHG